ncbi:MAG: SsrA-binding protein [Parcubacteria group bacterium CG08_land_8_20_14_0_20_43_9]|nr:MAG: SsrA-binding protein [Parcubacteria group bacterium CG08_land_8_20_14_0_20_43_9]
MARVLAENKKAFFDYSPVETFEAGIVLNGYEVKSIKLGRANLQGSFVVIKDEEPYLLNASVPPYQPNNTPKNYHDRRTRKLLLNKSEIKQLIGKSAQKGLTLVPLRMYTKQGKIKIEIAIAKHKGKADKREVLKKRAAEKDIRRALKEN